MSDESIDPLIDVACDRLVEHGLEVFVRRERGGNAPDATLALRWGGVRQRFSLYGAPAVRLARVLAARQGANPALVAAPWISPRIGEQLRAAQVAYVDSVGNASIRFGPVLVEVSGRPRPPRAPRSAPDGHEGPPVRLRQLVTPAHARVVSALLDEPALGAATLRDLAAAAGVSLGQAHKTATLLAEAGFHRDRLEADQVTTLRHVLDIAAG